MNLRDYGFEKVGAWKLYSEVKSGIAFYLSKYEGERVVYAFVIDDVPKYIGICEKDTTILSDRLGRYKHWIGAGTNERVAREIKECLEKDLTVEIYALKPEAEYLYEDLKVDLVKGLENPLIEKFRPEWNIR